MAYIQNFEKPETRHARFAGAMKSNYNPEDNPTVKPKGNKQESFFTEHIKQYTELISWARWYPDLFLDLIKPKKGGINLHFDQRIYLRAICRFVSVYGVFPRGWGKCVSGDTYIFSNKGVLPIKKFFNVNENGEEDYTPKLDLQVVNKEYNHVDVDRGVYNGKKNVKKIRTYNGYEISCSLTHPILCYKADGSIGFVEARNLKSGDMVIISKKNNIWGDKRELELNQEEILNKGHLRFPKELDGDLGLIIGYILALGGVSSKDKIEFYTTDELIRERLKVLIKRKFSLDLCDLEKRLTAKSVPFREFFRQIGFDFVQIDEKRIPECIMTAPRSVVSSVLRAYFTCRCEIMGYSDGKHLLVRHKSKELLQQIQMLLLNLGVVSSLMHIVKNTEIEGGTWQLAIRKDFIQRLKAVVGIDIPEKKREFFWRTQKRNVKTYGQKKRARRMFNKDDYYIDTIRSVKDDKDHVYDLSVPDTHSFVSNGFVSHNTWGEVISMFIIAILYPGITMALTAQTKANAAELLKDKYDEITRQYPLLKNEVYKPKSSKDDFELSFVNGSRIDVLANAQTSKGQRRNRIQIEESALIDNFTFEDALKPIVEIGRTTCGSIGMPDPLELNQQINFFTTSG